MNKVRIEDYSKAGWEFLTEGVEAFSAERYDRSVQLRQAVALEKIADRMVPVVEALSLIRSSLNRLADLLDPEVQAKRATDKTTADRLRREEQSRHRAGLAAEGKGQLRPKPGMTLADLNLSVRARNALDRLDVDTIDKLTEVTMDDLEATRNCGQTTIKEIRAALAKVGLTLAGEGTTHER